MALLLKGNELLATGPLSAEVLARLVQIAARRPLVINGITLHAEDIERLIEEARRTGQPVPLGTHEPNALPLKPLHYDYSSIPQTNNARPKSAFRAAASGKTGLEDETARPRRTYHDKVLDHATERLAHLTHLTEPDEVSRQFRTFLKLEDERLRIAHRLGSHGRWTAHARSFVFDVLITHAWRIATGTTNATGDGPAAGQHKCSIVALDGYGRGELAPFSDLDILFLHANRRSIHSLETIERVLHLLWDAGVTIEHRVRTVSECMAGVRADPRFQTGLMNMRLVAGNESYFQRLVPAFERAIRERPRAVIEDLREECALRRRKYGPSTCLQEPSVKEGAGGLRDFHAGLWAAYAAYECRTLEALSARRLITPERRARVEKAYDFLLRVRHESHWTMKRKADRITLDVQPTLAGNLGYRSTSHLRASEQFMRDYYRAARELHLFGELLISETFGVDERRRDEGDTSSSSSNRRRRRADRLRPVDEESAEETAASTPADEIFSITNGRLHLEADAAEMAKNPSLFFRAFALAQAAGVPLSRGLHEAITRSLSAVDHAFRQSPANAGEFLALLRRRGRVGRVLRLMHETGFLARYVPEFGRISLLIQHDNYHHYTIDEHTLRAVEALDEVDHDAAASAIQRLWPVFEEIEDIALVYLATLLHDLGKGRGSGHVVKGVKIAGRVCRRMGLDGANAAKVIALVNHHILIAHVSQRRDLSEPRVVREFAERIGDLDVLNMLLLLSHADLKGVGPGAWTEWKGSLLYELYRRARSHLISGETAHAPLDDRQVLAAEVHALLDGRASRSEVERHFTLLPDGYTRTVSAKAAAAHLAMIDRLRRGNRRVVCQWSPDHNTATALTIAAHDRRGLFAGIAGALAAQGIEILSADLNTRADAVVVDYLLLREAATHEAVAEHRWPNLERALEGAVSGAVDVGELIERWRKQNAPRRAAAVTTAAAAAAARHPQISFDNEIAEAMTIVEVRAADEPGLAYKLANAISSCDLNIARARIATEKSDAFDVFYVTTAENLKLSAAEMTRLREAVSRT